jgi:tyrosyl-tRNA synthetase
MSPITDAAKIDRLLNRGVEMAYPNKDAMKTALLSGRRLRIYLGVDPTAPVLHIGHAIQMKKLREFQELGHEVILLIGSFTAMIGDPTDKMAARQQLSAAQVMENAASYKRQAKKILKFTGDNAAKLMFNHKWLAKMNLADVVELASHFTVQQMSERDMFDKRLKEGRPVYLHEFMYPLMQGYDSVAMDVDVELGGSDQIFNMLAGRTLMREMKNKEKQVLSLKLLTNDEGKKMSKSEGGFVAIEDAPEEMYGKLMSMSDSMILPYFEIITDVPMEDIEGMKLQMAAGTNPRDLKMKLAAEVVTMFHGKAAAKRAAKHFASVFQQGEKPAEMVDFQITAPMNILDVLVAAKLTSSRGEGKQLIFGGGVRIDDVPVSDMAMIIDPAKLPAVLQKGKRHFIRLKTKD